MTILGWGSSEDGHVGDAVLCADFGRSRLEHPRSGDAAHSLDKSVTVG